MDLLDMTVMEASDVGTFCTSADTVPLWAPQRAGGASSIAVSMSLSAPRYN